MRNVERWRPSKFEFHGGRLRGSRNPAELGVGSRLVADIVAGYYQRHLRDHVGGRVLDLGCGKVPLWEAYRDLSSQVVCVDWGNTLHKNEFLDFECDLSQPLPFGDEEFDTIILSDVLEHLPQPELLWSEMTRIMRPSATLLMNVPFYYWLHETPFDFYRYTEFALRRFVSKAGLQLLHLESIGGAPEVMADVFAKCAVGGAPFFGRPLALGAQWLTALLLRLKIGRKFSDATKRQFPLGYFLIAKKI